MDAETIAVRDAQQVARHEGLGSFDAAPVVLQVNDLRKVFSRKGTDDVVAVDGSSFSLRAGECVGLVGESGSGKSTTSSLIMRMIEPTAGKVMLDGVDVFALPTRKLSDLYRHVQMVFQDPRGSFDPRRTLGAGIAEGLRNYRGMSRTAALARAKELLEHVGLPAEFSKRYAREVSGGQCQRAAIARAIALEPKLLICDEATSALDVTVQQGIVSLLGRLRAESGMAVLFVCHDIALAQQMCDRILVMAGGKIVESGDAHTVISNPQHPYTRQLVDSVL